MVITATLLCVEQYLRRSAETPLVRADLGTSLFFTYHPSLLGRNSHWDQHGGSLGADAGVHSD